MIDLIETLPRIAAGVVCGMAIGIDRSRQRKATGVRTLGLVGLGATLATLGMVQYGGDANAVGRVIQGVLTGIGFLGAGVILHGPRSAQVQGLTTAAAIWLTAILGVLCGIGEWVLALSGAVVGFILLAAGERLEDKVRGEEEHDR